MTPQEKAKHEQNNPVVNGKRDRKIHEWIEESTKDRLKEKAIELNVLLRQSNCRNAFENNFRSTYGQGWQQELF